MLTDNPPSQSMAFATNFEDFFNMDLLTSGTAAPTSTAGPSSSSTAGGGSSSRASSRSPQHSFSSTPLTPPQLNLSTDETNSLFNYTLDDDYSSLFKPESYASFPSGPYDLFGSFDMLKGTAGLGAADASLSGSTQSATPMSLLSATPSTFNTAQPQLAIDPQLMNAPSIPTPAASSHTPTEADEEDDDEGDAELEEDDDSNRSPSAQPQERTKGKAQRGTTVQYAGIKKSGGAAKENKLKGDDAQEPPFERPSPEEYAKMSSKEKRQLRNKISARNFRTRRKEYIHTLEGDVADRDRIIDAIREELSSTKNENDALRQEVAALKKAIKQGLVAPALPPPAPLSPMSPILGLPMSPLSPVLNSTSLPSTSSNTSSARVTSPLITPNTQKDLPSSPRIPSRRIANSGAFWGGSSANSPMSFGAGGFTPVHTTLLPDFAINVGKSVLANNNSGALANVQSQVQNEKTTGLASGENMNPFLNSLPASAEVNSPKANVVRAGFGFDAFNEMSPFTMKTMDAYRMQLWSRMAMQQAMMRRQAEQASNCTSPSSSSSPSPPPMPQQGSPLSGFASSLRPLHILPKPTASVVGLDKASSSAASLYPSPPTTPKMPARSHTIQPSHGASSTAAPTPQQAMLAGLASQTLMQKLGSAFWDAFSGSKDKDSKIPRTSGGMQAWDAEKVRKVIEGKAVLRVVDIDTAAPAAAAPAPLGSLASTSASSSSSQSRKDTCLPACLSADALAECVGALSLDGPISRRQS